MSDCKLICAIKDNVKRVRNIPGDVFNDNIKKEEINEIIIPNGVKQIEDSFTGWGFETITIPNSVELIAMAVFSECPNLEKIEVAKGNNKITMESSSFKECKNLKNLSIYSNDALIGSRAFEDCKKLETVVIKGANANIRNHVFANCENLKTVIIKGANVKIESEAFEGCKNLKTLSIPENAEVAEDAFSGCDKVPDKYKK